MTNQTTTFTASTSAELDGFMKAGAPKLVAGVNWTKLLGWQDSVGKDGFFEGVSKAEKVEINARAVKPVAVVETPKVAKVLKVKATATATATDKPVTRNTTTQKRIAAMAMIKERSMFKLAKADAIAMLVKEFDVPRNYASIWLKTSQN